MAKRETQRQRAERWARDVVKVDFAGRVFMTAMDGIDIHYATQSDMAINADAVRKIIVATWMRARRARR